jgi:hypothetical protein
LCWSLSAPGVGSTATTLKLYANDMGGQFIVSGTASFSLVTFPPTNVVLLAVGTAAFLNGQIQVALEGKGVSPSAQTTLQSQDYYLILNPATLNGTYVSNSTGTATFVACS